MTASRGIGRAAFFTALNHRHGNAKRGLRSREYRSWVQMWRRCRNQNSDAFRYYGARGVTVCEAWTDFAAFLEHIGPSPGAGYTLDRIDPTGNYEPGNVRWADPITQGRNRRNTTWITFGGITQCLSGWAEAAGVTAGAVRWRLKAGWPLDRALTRKETT